MAVYHLTLKKGKKGKAASHADYIMREGVFDNDRIGQEFVTSEIFNLPKWANTAKNFFRAADLFERTNGITYMEFEIALPIELSLEQNQELIRKFITECIGPDKVVTYAIHNKFAEFEKAIGLENDIAYMQHTPQPHAHIMFSTRCITDKTDCIKSPDLFFKRYNPRNLTQGGYKKDLRFAGSGNRSISREHLLFCRSKWADLVNHKYKELKIDAEITHLSLNEQKRKASKIGDSETLQILEKRKPVIISQRSMKKLISLIKTGKAFQLQQENNFLGNNIENSKMLERYYQKYHSVLTRIELESLKNRQKKMLNDFLENLNSLTIKDVLLTLKQLFSDIEATMNKKMDSNKHIMTIFEDKKDNSFSDESYVKSQEMKKDILTKELQAIYKLDNFNNQLLKRLKYESKYSNIETLLSENEIYKFNKLIQSAREESWGETTAENTLSFINSVNQYYKIICDNLLFREANRQSNEINNIQTVTIIDQPKREEEFSK